MNFKDLNIKSCYESGTDDIIEDFYEPMLSESVTYDRIAGFFSSSTLAVAARGLSNFIKNGGHMRLITSPRLNADDIDVIKKFVESPSLISCADMFIDLNNLEDDFSKDHVKALGWMLKHNCLQIKLAVVYDGELGVHTKEYFNDAGIFHQKVGILTDRDGNKLSFSGSINESASAWVNNDEEFKVFPEWEHVTDYFARDEARFEEIWNNRRDNVKVYDLPEAVKKELIVYSSDFDIESISIKKYREAKIKKYKRDGSLIPLFEYQSAALNKWRENDFRLLFEMATGTGKTRTAIGGIAYMIGKCDSLITIVSCPQNTLSLQWKKEVEDLHIKNDMSVIVDGTNHFWRRDLKNLLLKNAIGLSKHCIIYTTHNTASSEDFVRTMKEYSGKNSNLLFVGDEAHWLGATKFRNALLEIYQYRIGLSATPSRWFDDSGTSFLIKYFGQNSYELSIKEALTRINPLTNKHFLVNYYYHIKTCQLNDKETADYKQLTNKISKLSFKKDTDPDVEAKYERLIEARADIIKNASNKIPVFECLLDTLIRQGELEDLIIFVSPQQIDKVTDILNAKGIVFHKLTQSEGIKPDPNFAGMTERQYIIKKFVSKDYKALVAIKCLDEGIDIPTACRGILLSSSTNPREYVQRIGRIIRQAPNKTFAHLYDICVKGIEGLDVEEEKIEIKIREKEKIRLREISDNAINSAEALTIINEL